MNLAQCFVRFFSWSCLSFFSLCMLFVRCKAERREIFLIDYKSHLTPVGSIFLFSLVLYQKRSLFLCKILTRTHKYTRVHKLLSHVFFLSLSLLCVCVCISLSFYAAKCLLSTYRKHYVRSCDWYRSNFCESSDTKVFSNPCSSCKCTKEGTQTHTHTHTHTKKERERETDRDRKSP